MLMFGTAAQFETVERNEFPDEIVLHVASHAFDNGHYGDQKHYANANTQQSKRAFQLLRSERLQREPDCFKDGHGDFFSVGKGTRPRMNQPATQRRPSQLRCKDKKWLVLAGNFDAKFGSELIATFVAGKHTVAQNNHTFGVCGDVGFVRNHDNGLTLRCQVFEHAHDFFGRLRIEVTGRFVSEQNGRPVHECARNGNTLALTTGKFVGAVMMTRAKLHRVQGASFARS